MINQLEGIKRDWLAVLPYPAIILDANNAIQVTNRAFTRLTGFSQKDVAGRCPPYPFWPAEKSSRYQKDLLRRSLRARRVLYTKKGNQFWAEINLKPLDRKKAPSLRLLTFRDMSQLREVQKQYREAIVQNQRLLDAIPIPVSINNSDGTIIQQVNRSFLETGGFSKKEIIGCRTSYLPWDNNEHSQEIPAIYPVPGKKNEFEIHLKTKSGVPRVSLLKSSRAKIGSQEVTVAASVDITDRKQAEEALRVSEKRYLDTFENILEGCHILDFNWRFLFINPAAARQSRKPISESLGRTVMEVFPGIEKTPAFKAMRECMEKRISCQVENCLTYEDGTSLWFELSIHPVKEGIFILSVDIDKRKLAERAARSLALQQQAILENIPDMAWMKDSNLRFVAVNQAMLNFSKLTTEQLIGKTDEAIFPALSATKFRKDDEYVFEQKKSLTVEDRLPAKDGGYTWFETSKTPLLDDKGKVIGLAGIARNITQRKMAEIELQRVVQVLRAIRAVNRIITHERNAAKLLEDTCRTLTSVRGYVSCWVVHFDDKANLLWSAHSNTDAGFTRYLSSIRQGILPNCVRQALASADPFFIQQNDTRCSGCPTPVVIKDGFQVLVVPVKCAGATRGVFAAMIRKADAVDGEELDLLQDLMDDIGLALYNIQLEDQRAKTEMALRQSEERFRLISETTDDIIYRINLEPEPEIDYLSPSFFKILGYIPEEHTVLESQVAQLIHPADLPAVNNYLRIPAETGARPLVVRWKHASGSWVQIEHRHNVIYNASGQPQTIVGVGRDISEHVRLEASLRASEKLSQKLLEESPNPILVVNEDTTIRYANPALFSLTGFSPEEVIGRGVPFPWWPEENQAEYLSISRQVQQSGGIDREHLFRKKNGEMFWVINSIRVIYGNNNNTTEYLLANWIDITERKKAELALRQSEEKTRLVFASIADGIIICDLKGKILDCNDRTLVLAGAPKAEFIGRNIFNFIAQEDRPIAFENFQKTILNGMLGHIRYSLVRFDGGIVPAETIANVARDANGNPLYLVISFQDITEHIKMEKRLLDLYEAEKKHREELQEESRMRGMFIDVLAHELRTPLTPILASAGMLQDLLDETQNAIWKNLCVNISHGAETMARRLEDLLDVARYSRGAFHLNCAPVNLKTFLENVIERYKSALDQRRQELVITIADNLPVAQVDSSRLEQVILNLLSNASKFSPEGSRIGFNAIYQEGSLTFEVKDEGIGISEEEIKRLFKPYHRVEQDRQKFPGIGLGLAVSRQIVNAHGGTITVRSQPGQGSTFIVTLPLKVFEV